MRVSRERLRALVDEVENFHLRRGRLSREQAKIRAALESAVEISDADLKAYLKAVARYFGRFAREAIAHLRDVEKRLGQVAQVQFNLTAERGVAARRIEITQGVLSKLAELDRS